MSNTLFGDDIPEGESRYNQDGSYKLNPMHFIYGENQEYRCRQCKHFIVKTFAKKYFKCALRGDSNSPRTDHRATWFACGKFE